MADLPGIVLAIDGFQVQGQQIAVHGDVGMQRDLWAYIGLEMRLRRLGDACKSKNGGVTGPYFKHDFVGFFDQDDRYRVQFRREVVAPQRSYIFAYESARSGDIAFCPFKAGRALAKAIATISSVLAGEVRTRVFFTRAKNDHARDGKEGKYRYQECFPIFHNVYV